MNRQTLINTISTIMFYFDVIENCWNVELDYKNPFLVERIINLLQSDLEYLINALNLLDSLEFLGFTAKKDFLDLIRVIHKKIKENGLYDIEMTIKLWNSELNKLQDKYDSINDVVIYALMKTIKVM